MRHMICQFPYNMPVSISDTFHYKGVTGDKMELLVE